ncbi:SDR family oxidoreductase [Mycobacterium sp. C3-094]
MTDATTGRRDPVRTVVVTGASAGIGRAAAREFGRRGWRVALIARGHAGLEAAAAEVARCGGTPLVVPADVTDFDALDAAADEIERTLGPIDVWVNAAFATIFARFHEIEPQEFRRATDVSYLGFVHGTMVALRRMRPRDRGAIIQVGSALGERSVPLQSAYCGAKHAINGFTESLRTELLHDNSGVHVTVVQMPGVNTPQFSWVRSRLPRHPQPVAPVYQPEVCARAISFAADHPAQKQYWVGGSTVATLIGQRLCAPVLDRYLAKTGIESQQTTERVDREDGNLFHPVDDEKDFGAHGVFDDRSLPHSPAWWLRSHPVATAAAGLAAVSVAVAAGTQGH